MTKHEAFRYAHDIENMKGEVYFTSTEAVAVLHHLDNCWELKQYAINYNDGKYACFSQERGTKYELALRTVGAYTIAEGTDKLLAKSVFWHC